MPEDPNGRKRPATVISNAAKAFGIVMVVGGIGGVVAAQTPASPSFEVASIKLIAVKFHHETRELPAANLVMARSDRRLGPHLLPATEADSDCAARVRPDFSKPGFAGLPACFTSGSTGQNGTNEFSARGFTMEQLATTFATSFHIAPFIFNKTNLEGAFNIDRLEYRPDNLSAGPSVDASVDTPTILTALQEELGLKVEMIKGPVDVLVIDHAEHPTEN